MSERAPDGADDMQADLESIQKRLERLHEELGQRAPVDGDEHPGIASGDPVEMNPLTAAEPRDER